MVSTHDKNGNPIYISFTDDCGENEGGYYCEIYKGIFDLMDESVDYFVVHKEWIENAKNPLETAEKIVIEYVNEQEY